MEYNTLDHSGIKGMKWGIRRFQNKDGSLTPAGRKRYSDSGDSDGDKAKTTKSSSSGKKRASEMSDSELRERISRLNLEKSFRDLEKETQPKKRGKEFTLRVLEKIGEQSLVNIGTQAANKALGEAINKAFKVDSSDTVKRIVNPNKGQSDKK